MPAKVPYYMVKPLISLGATTPVEIQCFANNLETNVDQDESTAETFCGSYTTYKAEKWTIVVTCLQSFGADGLWNQIHPMVGTEVPFTILPDADQPVSADNPEMSGTARVKAFPFLSGAVNEAADFDLELAVQGMPVWSETGVMRETEETEEVSA